MKRLKIILGKILLCFLLLSMLSCEVSTKNPDTLMDPDAYLYTSLDSTLYRISPYSASVTPVCPDPLCEHDNAQCPFWQICLARMETVGNCLYYLRESGGWGEYYKKLCRYDLVSGEYTVLYAPKEGSMTELFATEEALYFNFAKPDGEGWNTFDVCRYDLSRGKIRVLNDEPMNSAQWAYAAENGRIFWLDLRSNMYYSTDADYGDRRDGERGFSPDATRENYQFDLENLGLNQETLVYEYRMNRIDRTTGEVVTVFDRVSYIPIIYGDRIIYAKADAPTYLGLVYDEMLGEWVEDYDRWGGKYYICELDGSGEQLLCDFGAISFTIPQITNLSYEKNGVGDWIALWAQHYAPVDESNSGKITYDRSALLLINIITGEIKEATIEKKS
ncbi:MAG: hypothetical protein IJW40_09775 [Clostridia bacterium]|nr:hypothetical protein [Clostridia bacterium]